MVRHQADYQSGPREPLHGLAPHDVIEGDVELGGLGPLDSRATAAGASTPTFNTAFPKNCPS